MLVRPTLNRSDSEQNFGTAIRERMNALDAEDPALAGISVASWLDAQRDPAAARAGFRSSIQGLWCRALEDIPLSFLVSNDRRVTNETSELQYCLNETMHALAGHLAGALGASVRTGIAVTGIEHGPEGMQVLAGGDMFRSRGVIVAVPPVAASTLSFSPALPARLAEALGSWASGCVIKFCVRYAARFWRDRDLSGMVMWHDPAGLFMCDNSLDAGHPALVMFAGGPIALEWREGGEAGIRRAATACLVEALGSGAAGFIDLTFRDWTGDRWSGGGYGDVLTLRAKRPDAEAVLREGLGPVQFAASELSPSFPGYIEGAIVAGREAAKRLAQNLGR